MQKVKVGKKAKLRCSISELKKYLGVVRSSRIGVKWTRELKYPKASDIPGDDEAACRLWILLRIARPQKSPRLRLAVPNPCILAKKLTFLYADWCESCGEEFEPMKALLDGRQEGMSNIQRMLYTQRGVRVVLSGKSTQNVGWNWASKLHEETKDLSPKASFEAVREAYRQI